MKLLVISDSHRCGEIVDRIIRRHSEINHVFFLGDHADDIDDLRYEYTDRSFYILSGNCDFFSEYPSVSMEKIAGHSILYAHGHTYGVKEGLNAIYDAAKLRGCDIVLYGHTHIPDITYKDGIYFVNPGSCARPRDGKSATYALIDISEKGIMPSIVVV